MKTRRENNMKTNSYLMVVLAIALSTTACEKGVFSLSQDGEEAEYQLPGDDNDTTTDVFGDPTGSDEGCVPNDRFFLREVWTPTVEPACAACHNAQGQAKDTELVLYNSGWGNYIQANYDVMADLALTKRDGESVLLLKATGQISHEGGQIIQEGDEAYARIEAFVNRVDSGMDCGAANDAEFYQDVEFLDGEQLLRKATLSLAGRVPTQAEYDSLATDGIDGVLDRVMTEDAFKARVIESYNDVILTDQFNRNEDAVDLLDEDVFPDRMWYDDMGDDDARNRARRLTNEALARESLMIYTHVIMNDKPFTDVLNADYTVVNPFSARSYGVMGDVTFNNDDDPNEWAEVQVPGMPHAGVLTTPVWLNKFPTTATNRNRSRAAFFYLYFLATDVLKLADRPLDPTQSDLSNNPTLFDSACTVCHNVIDPIAGAFQNWDDEGMYAPRDESWYTDMLPPGMEGSNIGQTENPESLRWLAARTTIDPRFIQAAVHTAYTMMTGDEPLTAPNDPTVASYAAEFRAYEVQYEFFKQVGKKFIESNYNFKALIKEIVKSPYYRAANARENIDASRQMELRSLGTARLLTPEMLHRKIVATTGTEWNVNNRNVLLDTREYNLLYGGIDSVSVLKRMEDPSAVASAISRRMANEVSCLSVPADFGREDEKVLFPHVTMDDTPQSNDAAVRENIKHLHFQLLGQKVEESDPQFVETYNLFNDVWQDGQNNDYGNGIPGMCRSNGVDNDPNYTVRAWMATVSYLLGSYEYIYE